MIKELGLSPAIMGVLLSAFFWVYSFMQMPAGWLVDRYGVRRSYAIGYAFWSTISALTGLANGLVSLIAARVLLGAGQSVAFPASARAVANWFPDRERGTVTGAYLMGVRLGQALVSIAAGYLLAEYGWKLFFAIIGVVPLLWLIPWNAFLKKWEHRGVPATAAATARAASPSFAKSLHLFRNRTVFGIFLDLRLRLCLVCVPNLAAGLSRVGQRVHSQGNGFLQLCSVRRHVGNNHAGRIGQRLANPKGMAGNSGS
jgi:MFS family permease